MRKLVFLLIIVLVFTACISPSSDDEVGSGTPSTSTNSSLPTLTGTVSISGIAEVGQTLTANTSSLGGSGTISYLWKREIIFNIGTDSNTYIVQSTDVGSIITVTVTRSNCIGSVTSPAIVLIPSISTLTGSTLTGTVSITGIAGIGQTLTANTSSLGGSGTISYLWKRGIYNIGTDSNTYTVQTADIGSTITVTVTRSGCIGSITSPAIGPILNVEVIYDGDLIGSYDGNGKHKDDIGGIGGTTGTWGVLPVPPGGFPVWNQ